MQPIKKYISVYHHIPGKIRKQITLIHRSLFHRLKQIHHGKINHVLISGIL